MPGQQIFAMGGGGFSMESSPVLDDYVLGLARSDRPRICFVPTASGDNEAYIVRFYRRFTGADCHPSHLELFRRTVRDLEAFARCPKVNLQVRSSNAQVVAFYRALGYSVEDRVSLGRRL